jgi:SSS family solute:Na+ symporter
MVMSPLDIIVIGLFIAFIFALGFSAKLRDNSVLQFIAAGRSLTLPVFVATLVSTWYGGILGIGESVSYYGLGTWVLLGVPYYLFAFIYAVYFAKKVRGSEQISLPERLESRYGKSVALLGAVLVFLLAVPAAHVLMLGTLVQFASGWTLTASVVVGTLVGTLFLYKGGLLADARVSLLAFVMMYVGFAVILGYCLIRYPFIQTINSLPNKDLLKWDGGVGISYVLSFLFLGAWTLVDPGFHQRVASCKSPEIGRKGVFVCIGFWFLFDMLTIGTGMYGIALHKESIGMNLYPVFGNEILPPGLKAVFFCGMLGTILSAMVGYTLVSGATLGREIISRIRPNQTDGQIKMWTRIGFFVACLIAIRLALTIDSVVNLWYAWGGVIIGSLLIPVSLSYGLLWKSKSSANYVFIAMVLAFCASLGLLIYGLQTKNPSVDVQLGDHRFSLGTLLPGLIVSGLIIGLGEAISRRRRQDE